MAAARGGDKLSAKLTAMARSLGKGTVVRIGFLEGATYPDGKPVAMIGAIQEFGAPKAGIPSRPYFRTMIRNKRGEWPKAIGSTLKANDYDARRTLDQVGAAVAGQLRQSITDLVSPPLAASTIARKGFDKPLIDTGHMLNSVDHEVVEPT